MAIYDAESIASQNFTVDLADSSLDLDFNEETRELFATKWASVWNGDECVGGTILACVRIDEDRNTDPYDAFLTDNGQPVSDWLERVEYYLDKHDGTDPDNLEWANHQEWSHIVSSV